MSECIRKWLPVFLLSAFAVDSPSVAGVYDDPKNLKVLPNEISAEDLRNTMKGFSLGLGLRCNECHASKPGQTWRDFDYMSDEKPLKDTARLMIRMMNDINGRHLAKLEPTGHERVRVRCVTCHRGQRLPRQMDEVLDASLDAGDVGAAVEKYRQLKKEYSGSHTYDFTELTLTEYARGLAERGELDRAIGIARLAATEFPQSFMPHYLLGEFHLKRGDSDVARRELDQALRLAPDQTWIKDEIDKIDRSEPETAR